MGWKKLRRVGKWTHRVGDWTRGAGGRASDRRKAEEEQLSKMAPEDRANMELWSKDPAAYQEQLAVLQEKYKNIAMTGKYTSKTGKNIMQEKVGGALAGINQELSGSYESSKGAITEAEELRRRKYAGTLLTGNRGITPLADASGGMSGKTLLGQ